LTLAIAGLPLIRKFTRPARLPLNFLRSEKKGDLAYKGTPDVEVPHKKPRGGELTAEQKEENRGLASIRVQVEHGIRRVKGFKIVRENYRHALGLFPMVASADVGLVHLNRILG